MTAYVSGNKNNNNEEGVFPDDSTDPFDNPRIEYLSEYLHRTQGKALGLVNRGAAHRVSNGLHRRLLAVAGLEHFVDVPKDLGLDATLGQHGQVLRVGGRHLAHVNSPLWWFCSGAARADHSRPGMASSSARV